jgi:hypothetical protein
MHVHDAGGCIHRLDRARSCLNTECGAVAVVMSTVADRDNLQERVLQWARADARVVAGAVVGSLAHHPGDQWSDLDLAFCVGEGVPANVVLDEWSQRLVDDCGAVRLFDLPTGKTIYRVFLLPDCLQFDLSFSPVGEFGAIGPNFRLLFGLATEKPFVKAPSAGDLFGYGVHHAVRALVCIERGRYWQAEYWISGVRDQALTLACLRLNLPAYYGRGFDDLPDTVTRVATGAIVRSLDRAELLDALCRSADLLFDEGHAAGVCPLHLTERVVSFISVARHRSGRSC